MFRVRHVLIREPMHKEAVWTLRGGGETFSRVWYLCLAPIPSSLLRLASFSLADFERKTFCQWSSSRFVSRLSCCFVYLLKRIFRIIVIVYGQLCTVHVFQSALDLLFKEWECLHWNFSQQYTPEIHRDKYNLLKAISVMADVANAINEFKRRKDLGEDVNYCLIQHTNTFITLVKLYRNVLISWNLAYAM